MLQHDTCDVRDRRVISKLKTYHDCSEEGLLFEDSFTSEAKEFNVFDLK